jgi:hypothetical protein
MAMTWSTVIWDDPVAAIDALGRLPAGWLYRGQARAWGTIVPSIDRPPTRRLGRPAKLDLERDLVDGFRTGARSFLPGEEPALHDLVVALAVLRHHGVPTRLVDWTADPLVAAYFATEGHRDAQGEIWGFEHEAYRVAGEAQWRAHPETTDDGSGDSDRWRIDTAFDAHYVMDWFVCAFYGLPFPRQSVQKGAYSMTAQFGTDHAVILDRLLPESARMRIEVAPAVKPALARALRDRYGITRATLFPDAAGAAETALLSVGLRRQVRGRLLARAARRRG